MFVPDISYVKGRHNIKAGVTLQHTFLTEDDKLGIVDPTFLPSLRMPERQSGTRSVRGSAAVRPDAGRRPIRFQGHTDIKEVALYIQDTITAGNWSFNLGVRGDIYRGLSQDSAS